VLMVCRKGIFKCVQTTDCRCVFDCDGRLNRVNGFISAQSTVNAREVRLYRTKIKRQDCQFDVIDGGDCLLGCGRCEYLAGTW
jgi:hypothetical protein